jgi:subtilase family serine protease
VRYGFPPCSAYYGQEIATTVPPAYGYQPPWAVCGYTPPQYESAYGLTPEVNEGDNGHGVTIAIVDAYAEPSLLSDNNHYDKLHGVAPFARGQFREIVPNSFDLFNKCSAPEWGEEQTMDVESSHGLAPGANLVYVGGANCGNGLLNAWAQTIDNHVADVISDSWLDGTEFLPVSTIDFYQRFAEEAVLTGISVNFSSGDDGDEIKASGQKQVSLPASDPYVTAVGGTSIAIGASGQYLFEHGWENAYSTLENGAWTPPPPGAYSSGSGGGTSQIFAQPSYQVGVVPASISEVFGSTPARAVPDISMAGDPNTGFLVGETQAFPDGTYYSEYRLGGTSLSSPLFAGVEADLDSALGTPVGFINPDVYPLVGSSALHDIVPPKKPIAEARIDYLNGVTPAGGTFIRLRTMDVQFTSIHSGPGYDDETGVGTPNGDKFFDALGG